MCGGGGAADVCTTIVLCHLVRIVYHLDRLLLLPCKACEHKVHSISVTCISDIILLGVYTNAARDCATPFDRSFHA